VNEGSRDNAPKAGIDYPKAVLTVAMGLQVTLAELIGERPHKKGGRYYGTH
jgi:hypothetical protein